MLGCSAIPFSIFFLYRFAECSRRTAEGGELLCVKHFSISQFVEHADRLTHGLAVKVF